MWKSFSEIETHGSSPKTDLERLRTFFRTHRGRFSDY